MNRVCVPIWDAFWTQVGRIKCGTTTASECNPASGRSLLQGGEGGRNGRQPHDGGRRARAEVRGWRPAWCSSHEGGVPSKGCCCCYVCRCVCRRRCDMGRGSARGARTPVDGAIRGATSGTAVCALIWGNGIWCDRAAQPGTTPVGLVMQPSRTQPCVTLHQEILAAPVPTVGQRRSSARARGCLAQIVQAAARTSLVRLARPSCAGRGRFVATVTGAFPASLAHSTSRLTSSAVARIHSGDAARTSSRSSRPGRRRPRAWGQSCSFTGPSGPHRLEAVVRPR